MKRAKFQAHVGELTWSQIQDALQSIKEFSNLKEWHIKHLGIGEMTHTYFLTRGSKEYFIKEVKPHEAQVNYFLCKLIFKHLPHAVYPELLDKKVLVLRQISGGMMPEKSRILDYGLLEDFIAFQNKMNDRHFFDRYNKFGINNFEMRSDKTRGGFFVERGPRNLKIGRLNLLKAKKKYKLAIIDKYIEIANHLKPIQPEISKEFGQMPFARQHHDFREDNILGKNHMLIDWGSSYGYGPFMYDLSLFLVSDKNALNILMKKSEIANRYSREQVERWIYVALADRFNDFCKWHIAPGTPNERTKARLQKALEYNYQTYKNLLKV